MTKSTDPTMPEPTTTEQPTPPQAPEPTSPAEPEPDEVPDPEPVQEVPEAWDEQRAALDGVPAPVSEPEHDPATTDPSGAQNGAQGAPGPSEGEGA